jgi:hypothetical protein
MSDIRSEFEYVKIYGLDGKSLQIKQMVAVGDKLFASTEDDGIYMLETERPLNRFQRFIKKLCKI